MSIGNGKLVVSLKLPQLQNLIKRDPQSYKDEFYMQKRRFESELEIFKLRPSNESERFTDLVTFMSHVAPCYDNESDIISSNIIDVLNINANNLHPDVRSKLFQALVQLRKRNCLDPVNLLKLCFRLFDVSDKTLRISVYDYILNDIKAMHLKKKDDKQKNVIQSYLYSVVSDDKPYPSKKTVELLSQLYRSRIWTDERTVNVIASATNSTILKIRVSAIEFFLGIETKMFEDDDEENKTEKTGSDVNYHEHSKKTKKRIRQVKKQVVTVEKNRKNKDNDNDTKQPLFPAIQLINNPLSLAENLFKKMKESGERFEVKLLLMNFISRLIGCHKLFLLNFYSYILRYITSSQKDITKILTYLIQACHDLVPPEDLIPVIKAIAYNFITERCSNEVIAVGINTVREILFRVPSLLHEQGMDVFIQDLSMYSKKMHKIVMIAARSVINLVRDTYPSLLLKSDRGKNYDPSKKPNEYGDVDVQDGVDGADLLESYEKGEITITDDGLIEYQDRDTTANGEDITDVDDNNEEYEDEDEGNDDDEDDNDEDDEEEEFEDIEDYDEVNDSDDGSGDSEDIDMTANVDKPIQKSIKKYRIDTSRIFSQEDFDMIARLKLASENSKSNTRNKRKAHSLTSNESIDDSTLEDSMTPFSVSVDTIGVRTTNKSTKIERLTKILEGRKDSIFEHEGHRGGLTNKEKERKKNFVMVRKGKRSLLTKMRRSNSEVRYAKNHHKDPFGRDKRKRRRV